MICILVAAGEWSIYLPLVRCILDSMYGVLRLGTFSCISCVTVLMVLKIGVYAPCAPDHAPTKN